MTRRGIFGSFFLVWVSFAAVCSAQIPDRAEVTGRMTDETGAILSGVSLTLSNDATGYKFSQTSSATGDFVFQFLPTGLYTLKAELPKFETLRIQNIRLALNQHLDLQAVTLKVGSPTAELDVT